jgi:hypothetical protein
MSTYQSLRTGVWEISLPSDWAQKQAADQGSLYFESADGTKGMYISTWDLGDDRRSPQQVVQSFKDGDLGALRKMEGYSWVVLSEAHDDAVGACAAVTDYFASARRYRSIGKILAAPPIVVRAAFQDYACVDLDASSRYFEPIIGSLQFATPAG